MKEQKNKYTIQFLKLNLPSQPILASSPILPRPRETKRTRTTLKKFLKDQKVPQGVRTP